MANARHEAWIQIADLRRQIADLERALALTPVPPSATELRVLDRLRAELARWERVYGGL